MGERMHSSEKLSVNLFRHGEHLMEGVHSSQVGCSDSERAALTKFKRKLIDPSNVLTSWGVSPDCCQWSGVACHNETGSVVQLDLHYGNLSGDIDPALTELKHLKYLDLSRNHFVGVKIPEFFGSLKELKHLNISYAGFRGRIPHHLGNLSNLELLDVSSFPKSYSYYMSLYYTLIYSSRLNADSLDWMVNMPLLKHLEMNFVNLSMIGSRWFHVMNSLSSLQILHLRGSYLSDIPPALPFTNLTQLRSLDLSYNQFFSEIPNWFANITTLVSIHLNDNKFYGDMSSKFPTLPCLQVLQLEFNYGLTAHLSKLFQGPWKSIRSMFLFEVQLYGELPESIGNLSSLQHLILGDTNGNQVIKGIPRQIGHLHNLKGLMLYGFEDQTGSMREWLCPLVNLQILYIQNCHFPESIPTCLGGSIPWSSVQFTMMRSLHLENNQLSGVFPSFLKDCAGLQTLDFRENKFTGSLPAWIGTNLPNLRILLLRSNKFTGTIPHLLNLHHLKVFDLSNNHLIGSIPESLKDLMAMKMDHTTDNTMDTNYGNYRDRVELTMNGQQYEYENTLYLVISLDISGNNLSGKIPEAIGDLLGLINLNLSRNQLSGKIPESIGNLHQLINLDLSKNYLFGMIPSTIADLTFLSHLNLSYNNLSGKIPLGQQVQSLDDPSIYAGNDNLCGYPLIRDCERDTIVPLPSHNEVDDGSDIAWLYAGIGPGFAVGLLTVFGILLFKTSWRVKYFRFVDAMQEYFHW
ncbi:receptor-like protein EIX2 [Aristolochia californica]|uniref:receptor-like protein EIX2 n=1 Tax=Aristolochia californica TaxID=171875 RepID=UPI0035E11199